MPARAPLARAGRQHGAASHTSKGPSCMRVINQETTTEPITAVTPHPRNPRKGNLEVITESISKTGFYGAVIAQRSTGHILAGNHRYLAAKEAGAQTIPVTWLDVDDETALRILLVDNRANDVATYDDQALADLLLELQKTGDLGGIGYTGDDINRALKTLTPDDDDTEDADKKLTDAELIQQKWQVQPGDVWRIPSHTNPTLAHLITCQDSTNAERMRALGPVDMVFTDPPYGVDYVGGTEDALEIQGDHLKGAGLEAFIHDAAKAWPLKPGGAYYVCSPGGDNETHFRNGLERSGHPIRQGLVWVKNALVLGRSDYHYRHETILYGWRPGPNRYFTRDRTEATTINAPANLKDLTPDELRAEIRRLRREIKDTVWLEDKPSRSRLHPTTKPIHLATRAIYNSSLPGQTVFDGFNGSGSTGLAAEAAGRKYVGVELDPNYVAVTLERFHERGLTPVRQEPTP